jgi:hypothetical protein
VDPVLHDLQVALDVLAAGNAVHNGGEPHRHIRRHVLLRASAHCVPLPAGRARYLAGLIAWITVSDAWCPGNRPDTLVTVVWGAHRGRASAPPCGRPTINLAYVFTVSPMRADPAPAPGPRPSWPATTRNIPNERVSPPRPPRPPRPAKRWPCSAPSWTATARGSLDRHATYIAAAYVAGAAR